jgi:hypothetical protein
MSGNNNDDIFGGLLKALQQVEKMASDAVKEATNALSTNNADISTKDSHKIENKNKSVS